MAADDALPREDMRHLLVLSIDPEVSCATSLRTDYWQLQGARDLDDAMHITPASADVVEVQPNMVLWMLIRCGAGGSAHC